MSAKGAAIVSWDPSYSVGMEEIDAQHQALFSTINRLWNAIVGKGSQDEVLGLIDELERYTVAHFSAEEDFMQASGYPGFPAHQELHQHFVQRIAAEKAAVVAGKSISLDLLRFLKDWLVQHIQGEDLRYAAHVRQAPAQGGSLGAFFKRFWA